MAMALLLSFFFIPTLLLILFLWKLLAKRQNSLLLPPGPPCLPIIGNLHQVNRHHPHLSLYRLAQKYGPIIHLQLGQVPTVVISSAELAKEAIKANDLVLSNRPFLYSAKYIFYNFTDMAYSPYGDYWRKVRKLCTLELFSSKRVQSFGHVREQEVARLVRRIGSSYPKSVNLSEMLGLYANDALCRAAFGKIFTEGGDFDRHGFQDMLNEYQILLGGFSVGDFFPSLEWINLVTGMKQRLVRLSSRFDAFFDELIEQHLHPNKATSMEKDLVEILLSLQKKNESNDLCLTMDNIKALLMVFFLSL